MPGQRKRFGPIRAITPALKLPEKTERLPRGLTPSGRASKFYKSWGKHMDAAVRMLVPEEHWGKAKPVRHIYGALPIAIPEHLSSGGLSAGKADALHSTLIGSRLADGKFERRIRSLVLAQASGKRPELDDVNTRERLLGELKPLLPRFSVRAEPEKVLDHILSLEAGRRKERMGAAFDGIDITVHDPTGIFPRLNTLALSHEVGHSVLRQTKKNFPHGKKGEVDEMFAHAFSFCTLWNGVAFHTRQESLDQYKTSGKALGKEFFEAEVRESIKDLVDGYIKGFNSELDKAKQDSGTIRAGFHLLANKDHLAALTRLRGIFERNGWDLRKSMLEVRDTVYGA